MQIYLLVPNLRHKLKNSDSSSFAIYHPLLYFLIRKKKLYILNKKNPLLTHSERLHNLIIKKDNIIVSVIRWIWDTE